MDVFSTQRPEWADPIHDLMVASGVSAFFHGHDHQYAYEVVDGIVYQEVPAPGMTGSGFNLYSESDPNTLRVLPNSGYMRVTVSPNQDLATVEYVRSDTTVPGTNGVVSHSYTIDANAAVADTPLYRVNAGGGDEAMSDGNGPFLGVQNADLSAITGLTIGGVMADVTTTEAYAPVNTTTVPTLAVYQTGLRAGASGTMTYDFDVDPGVYDVNLYFGEHAQQGVGGRVFDISVQGNLEFDDYDYFALYGENVAITETVSAVTVTGTDDLNITIDASQSGDVPVIRGIQILVAGGDFTPPVVTLLGNDVEAVSLGATYTDAGATALDDVDGDITDDIVVGGDTVDTNTIGMYEITYNVFDTAGNAAAEVTRTVFVIENGTPLYRVNNGGPDIPMTGEADFLGIDSSTLDAIPGLNANGDFATDVTITDPINMDNVNSGLPEALFQSLMRTSATTGDVINFDFSVPNGDYDVLLHWAEHNDTIEEGERLFDVSIEGVLVLDSYDIFVESGGEDIAITETEATTVNDGVLNLAIAQQTSVAIIRGIEIVPTDVPTAVSLHTFSETTSGLWQLAVLSLLLIIGTLMLLTNKFIQRKR